ncbi:MAG TPA: hypothetical protein VHS03_02885 [Gaiellaceae bacterium]|jgi:hypothetical protein|nr:hypothetical protein [Gaiellaceae bacterium]
MTQLVAHGLAVTLPTGWEGRILRRTPVDAQDSPRTVVHCATFPLPEQRDDFGGGVTNLMRSSDVFVVVFEYGPESVGQPLFASQGVPRLDASAFSGRRLQRPLPGQLGCQRFFTVDGRAFCLYVVAGSRASLAGIVSKVNQLLAELVVQP